ncbi:MAG: hypothetical protein IPK68_14225 [Bdellovibrionales bacterium]|nr:hypothetical protein [Bdellovibrionales bacterium]
MSDLETIDWQGIVERLAKLATSEAGRSDLWRASPLESPLQPKSFRVISEVQNIIEQGNVPLWRP